MLTLNIPLISTDDPPMEVEVKFPLFVLGVNGSGKSALLHCIAESKPKVKLLAGGRQLWLTTPILDTMVSNRQGLTKQREGRNFRLQERTQDSVKDGFPGAALHQLADRENELARRVMYSLRDSDGQTDKVDELLEDLPPFQRLNQLLSTAGFPFSLEIAEGRAAIHAVRNDSHSTRYGIDTMSDGERNAILTAAEVLAAEPCSTFLIDEPERHLHPSITVPFLSALFATREDCDFLVATNQLDLPLVVQGSKSLVVRSCRWEQGKPVGWDVNEVDFENGDEDLSEDIKRAILGARKKILFVEGTEKSLDMSLYPTLFPGISVTPAGSCEDVIRAVDGLRNSKSHHEIAAFGLIDRDARPDNDVRCLAQRGIHALPYYSVESLYYCDDAIDAVARRQASNFGCDANDMATAAREAAISAVRGEGERMAARVCEHRMRDMAKSQMTWKLIRDSEGESISIKVESVNYSEELSRYKRLVDEGDIEGLVARYPLRESGAFSQIASNLYFQNKDNYQSFVVARVRESSELAEALRSLIKPLADALIAE